MTFCYFGLGYNGFRYNAFGRNLRVTVRVDGVVVIPMQDGYAYTHTEDGRCVLLSGPRSRMIDLCSAVKHSQQTGGPEIYVDALEFPDYGFLSVEECPLHGHAAA